MNKLHTLFIRALKSSSDIRFEQVYKRNYLCEFSYAHGVNILLDICEKHYPIQTRSLLAELSPNNSWKWNGDYFEKCFKILASHLRLAPVFKLNGYTIPLRHRSKVKCC